MIRPAPRIIRELPPSLTAYRVRFPSAPPRLGCLLSCGVRRLNVDEKKPLGLAPSETGNPLRDSQPLTGPELELTVFLLASHFQQCADYNHNVASHVKKYFGGVNGGIEPSLTESQSAVLPLHYEHRSGQ